MPKLNTLKILYYAPKPIDDYRYWVYGLDVIEQLQQEFPQHKWIAADGSLDPETMYDGIDLYLRPSRHDGWPRMVKEAKEREIPVYFSADGKPDFMKICELIEGMQDARS